MIFNPLRIGMHYICIDYQHNVLFKFNAVMKKITFILVMVLTVGISNATFYVTPTGTGDGSSWATALGSIQAAIDAAAAEFNTSATAQEVWVASGTYSTATAALIMKAGVNLYGGFAGTETTKEQRVKGTNPWDYTNATILNGGNAKRCIEVSANFTSVYVIDGFTITNGNGQGLQLNNSGGGLVLRANLKLQNSIVTGNTTSGNGGGVNMVGGIVSNCWIYNNVSTSGTITAGGGVYSAPATGFTSTIEQSVIERNTNGGIRAQAAGSTYIDRNIIRNNTSTGNGASIYLNNPTVCEITNNLITNNSGTNNIYLNKGKLINNTVVNNEGGIYLASATNVSEVYNNIIVGNVVKATTTPTSVSVVTGYPGGKVKYNATWPSIAFQAFGDATDSILTTDAATAWTEIAFVAPTTFAGVTSDPAKLLEIQQADWKVGSASLALNSGDNSYLPSTITTDFAGLDRIVGTAIDLGAYERPEGTTAVSPLNGKSFQLTVEGRQLIISGLDKGETVSVYQLNGMLVKHLQVSSDISTVAVGQGLYLVKSADKVQKVIVR